MTDQPKKTLPPPRSFFSRVARAFVTVPESAASDPFDDAELDAFLTQKVEEGAEPNLLIVDRLLNKSRFRREC